MIHVTVTPFAAVTPGLLLYAALRDIVARTVPNLVSLGILAAGCCVQAMSGHLAACLLIGAGVFAVALCMWKRRWLGGADVKLLAATAVAVPPMTAGLFLLSVAIAGGALAIAYLVLAHVVPRPVPGRRTGILPRVLKIEAWRIRRYAPLPYATAIAAGALFTLLPGHG